MTSAALRAGPVLQGALCWAVGLGRGPQGCGALCSRHLGAHAPNEAAPWDADLAHLAARFAPPRSPRKGEDVAVGSPPWRWVSAAPLMGLGAPRHQQLASSPPGRRFSTIQLPQCGFKDAVHGVGVGG